MSAASTSECILNDKNICNLSSCIKSVKSVAGDSLSPSEQWIVEFKNNTIYEESKTRVTIYTGFMKIFFNLESSIKLCKELFLINAEENDDDEEFSDKVCYLTPYIQALNYETSVYSLVIKPILENKESPHFIRYYTQGDNCSYDSLLNILISGNVKNADNKLLTILYAVYSNQRKININDDKLRYEITSKYKRLLKKAKYNFILNQAIDPSTTIKFSEWSTKNTNTTELYILLFQITQACYALFIRKTAHNDLHLNNIWVSTRLDVSMNIRYTIGSKHYDFYDIKSLARLYDFDRAYCETIGPNVLLDEKCDKYGHCNELIESKDIIKVICKLVKHSSDVKLRLILMSFIAEDIDMVNTIFDENVSGCFLTPKKDGKLFSNCYKYPQILDMIYNAYSKEAKVTKKTGSFNSEYVLP